MNILYDRNMVLGEALFPRLGKAKAIEGRSLTAKDLAKELKEKKRESR